MQLPSHIGAYKVVRPLGEGGMAIVVEALRTDIQRRVAIKLLKAPYAADPDMGRRFLNEARAVNQVDNPGVVPVSDHGLLPDGTPYIVMELLTGETLTQRLHRAGGRLPFDQLLRLARGIARTLAAAHQCAIIHRDLKPDNIMIVRDDEAEGGERVKLLDFGIAKLSAELGGDRTGTLVFMGTPRYMSPEQCRGASQVDARSDVYSLGVILFLLTSGRLPFLGESDGELIGQHLFVAPLSLHDVTPEAPAGLVQLVNSMLAKEPAQRPTSGETSRELSRLIAGLPATSPAPFSRPVENAGAHTLLLTMPSHQTPEVSAQAVTPAPRAVPWGRLAWIGLIAFLGAGAGVLGAWQGLHKRHKIAPSQVTRESAIPATLPPNFEAARAAIAPPPGQGPTEVLSGGGAQPSLVAPGLPKDDTLERQPTAPGMTKKGSPATFPAAKPRLAKRVEPTANEKPELPTQPTTPPVTTPKGPEPSAAVSPPVAKPASRMILSQIPAEAAERTLINSENFYNTGKYEQAFGLAAQAASYIPGRAYLTPKKRRAWLVYGRAACKTHRPGAVTYACQGLTACGVELGLLVKECEQEGIALDSSCGTH